MNSNSDRTYQKYMPSDFASYINSQLECHPAKYDAKANILDYGSKTDAITTQAMLGLQLAAEGGPLDANLMENYLRPRDWPIR
jgi:hypothetical protein